jgi:hypothetical protein
MLPKSQRVIQGEADVRRLVYWIRACYVLHNPALQDPVEAEWLEDEEEDDGGVPVAEIGESATKLRVLARKSERK